MTSAWLLQVELTREGDDFTAYIADADLRPGFGYRVVIQTPNGDTIYRRDPYALECDFRSSWCVAVNPRLWVWQHWRIPDFDTYLIYELHVGSFTPEGTFQAAKRKLQHILGLGFTCVQLMPITEHSDDWGYNPRLLTALHGGYGTPADFYVQPSPLHCSYDAQHSIGLCEHMLTA